MIEVTPFEGDGRFFSFVISVPGYPTAVVVDPGISLKPMVDFLQEKRLSIGWILLTGATLASAARAAEMRSRWKAKIAAAVEDLPLLQRLPQLGEEAGLCGVKVPQVDHPLGSRETLVDWAVPIEATPRAGGCLFRIGDTYFGGNR